jgi:hypothetical protein
VYIQKSDDLVLYDGVALHIQDLSVRLQHTPDGDMAGNEGVGDSRQLAVVEMNVGTADLATEGFENDGTRLEIRLWIFPDFYGGVRGWHDGGVDHGCKPRMCPGWNGSGPWGL